jgi:NitT/TauT family transport system ATP-binding protein
MTDPRLRSTAPTQAATAVAQDGLPASAGSPPASPVLLQGITKAFGAGADQVVALQGIDLEVRRGELVCLVGASGCGKSTMLNLIAGLDRPTEGTVEVDGRTSLMFQDAALFPWLTVRGNVELAMRLQGVKKAERRARAAELLDTVHLGTFAKKQPHQLSGGMRQRVAIARAFAQDAEVLLMDEPFGALDAMTRDLLHDELEDLWRRRDLTVLFVTHNVREAVRLADRVFVLSSRPGRVVAEVEVDLPRPRRMDSAEVAGLAATITDRLREEVRHHAAG